MKFKNMLHKMMNKSCKHDYKPIKFACVTNDEYGTEYYYYAVQCMLCGRKPLLLRRYRDKQSLYLPFKEKLTMDEIEKIIVGTSYQIYKVDDEGYETKITQSYSNGHHIGNEIKSAYAKDKIKKVLENNIHIATSLTAQQIDEIAETMVHELRLANCQYLDFK